MRQKFLKKSNFRQFKRDGEKKQGSHNIVVNIPRTKEKKGTVETLKIRSFELKSREEWVKDQTTKRNNILNIGRKGEMDQGGLEEYRSIRGDLVELSSYLV